MPPAPPRPCTPRTNGRARQGRGRKPYRQGRPRSPLHARAPRDNDPSCRSGLRHARHRARILHACHASRRGWFEGGGRCVAPGVGFWRRDREAGSEVAPAPRCLAWGRDSRIRSHRRTGCVGEQCGARARAHRRARLTQSLRSEMSTFSGHPQCEHGSSTRRRSTAGGWVLLVLMGQIGSVMLHKLISDVCAHGEVAHHEDWRFAV